jgi:hypothetical protein
MIAGAGAGGRSQSRLSRSRLDPAWSLQECRWAPCVRGHDPGQGQLPCESYRPPGQLLETHPAALLAHTYVLFAKNQSTSGREGPVRPAGQLPPIWRAAGSPLRAVDKSWPAAASSGWDGNWIASSRFDGHPCDAEPCDRRAGPVGGLRRRQGDVPVCGDEALAVHRLGLIGQQPKQWRDHDGGL